MTSRTADIDLKDFFKKYNLKFPDDFDVRKTPKQKLGYRISRESFVEQELYNTIKDEIEPDLKVKKNFLFSHFSPFVSEIEGLGLPLYCKLKYPNSIVTMTYDKGGNESFKFTLNSNGTFCKISKLSQSYDLIIARSSSLINMMSREIEQAVIKNSGFTINIKTMSYNPNYKYADYYFDEEDMCPPPDPVYVKKVEEFLKTSKKKNLIILSGTLWYIKNQLSFVESVDPDILKDFNVVFMGPERDGSYVKKIREICETKGINYYLIGNVNKDVAAIIKAMSKISIIPMDMTVFGQPKGYPRTLGESIGSKCITLCNNVVTVPDFYRESVITYDAKLPNDINEKLSECIQLVKDENFVNNYPWGKGDFYHFCDATLTKCFALEEASVALHKSI